MRVAVGKPGEAVRAYVTGSTAVIEAQLQDEEVAIETAARGPAVISEDGTEILPA